MQVAYICGPYRAPTIHQTVLNIRRAEEAALALWRMGYAVICPHKNSSLLDGACDDSVWLEGDLELLRRSDLIVTLPGWEQSEGSRREVVEARKLGIPVYSLDEIKNNYLKLQEAVGVDKNEGR